jgi:hypothetical protein
MAGLDPAIHVFVLISLSDASPASLRHPEVRAKRAPKDVTLAVIPEAASAAVRNP